MRLEAARERLAFALPGWLPEGFMLEPLVRIPGPPKEPLPEHLIGRPITFPASASLMWRHADERWLGLDAVSQLPRAGVMTGFPSPIPPDGVKEVSVHGRPAALISKMWVTIMNTVTGEEGGAQVKDDMLHLEWELNDINYVLRTVAGHVTEAELIRVAESIR